jgi:hypothetical protein
MNRQGPCAFYRSINATLVLSVFNGMDLVDLVKNMNWGSKSLRHCSRLLACSAPTLTLVSFIAWFLIIVRNQIVIKFIINSRKIAAQ